MIPKIAVCFLLVLMPFALSAQTYDDRVLQARQALKSGQIATGLNIALGAVQLDSSRWEAYVVAGTAYSMQGQNAEASRLLGMGLARAPQDKRPGIQAMISQIPVAEPPSPQFGPPPSSQSLADNPGIWLDPATGKAWTRDPSPDGYNWSGAREYCQSLTLGGINRWRLPDYNTEYDTVRKNRATQFRFKQGFWTGDTGVWSGTEAKPGKTAYVIGLVKMDTLGAEDQKLGYRVICVTP